MAKIIILVPKKNGIVNCVYNKKIKYVNIGL